MKQTLALAEWLTSPRPANTPIAWLDERHWTLGHLRHDVARLMTHLQQQEGSRWALCFENSYLFIVALLATLHAGKTPVIPGHNRVSLLDEQRAWFDGVLSDKTLGWQGPLWVVSSAMTLSDEAFIFPPLRHDAFIELLPRARPDSRNVSSNLLTVWTMKPNCWQRALPIAWQAAG